MSQIREKIKIRFHELQQAMIDQRHLNVETIDEVLLLIEGCSKFWRILSCEERDFLNAVRLALEDQLTWA